MWSDYIIELGGGKDILLFSTATTGLKPGRDELIAFSYHIITPSGEVTSDTIFNGTVDVNELEKSSQYHEIPSDILALKGFHADDFASRISELMKDRVCFSYNPSFQCKFLDALFSSWSEDPYTYVFDLPLMVKLAASKMMIDDQEADTLVNLEKAVMKIFKVAPSIKAICAKFDVDYEHPASVYPVEHYANCLLELWNKALASTQIDVQEDLFE